MGNSDNFSVHNSQNVNLSSSHNNSSPEIVFVPRKVTDESKKENKIPQNDFTVFQDKKVDPFRPPLRTQPSLPKMEEVTSYSNPNFSPNPGSANIKAKSENTAGIHQEFNFENALESQNNSNNNANKSLDFPSNPNSNKNPLPNNTSLFTNSGPNLNNNSSNITTGNTNTNFPYPSFNSSNNNQPPQENNFNFGEKFNSKSNKTNATVEVSHSQNNQPSENVNNSGKRINTDFDFEGFGEFKIDSFKEFAEKKGDDMFKQSTDFNNAGWDDF